MAHIVLFYLVQLCASGYALLRGGAPEKLVATAMLIAVVATTSVTAINNVFSVLNVGGLMVDLVLLAALVGVAGRAERYWPIYVAGLHLLAIGVHGVRAYDASILPLVYYRAPVAVAYPMIGLLVIGTLRHTRRLRLYGEAERDWSTFRW